MCPTGDDLVNFEPRPATHRVQIAVGVVTGVILGAGGAYAIAPPPAAGSRAVPVAASSPDRAPAAAVTGFPAARETSCWTQRRPLTAAERRTSRLAHAMLPMSADAIAEWLPSRARN